MKKRIRLTLSGTKGEMDAVRLLRNVAFNKNPVRKKTVEVFLDLMKGQRVKAQNAPHGKHKDFVAVHLDLDCPEHRTFYEFWLRGGVDAHFRESVKRWIVKTAKGLCGGTFACESQDDQLIPSALAPVPAPKIVPSSAPPPKATVAPNVTSAQKAASIASGGVTEGQNEFVVPPAFELFSLKGSRNQVLAVLKEVFDKRELLGPSKVLRLQTMIVELSATIKKEIAKDSWSEDWFMVYPKDFSSCESVLSGIHALVQSAANVLSTPSVETTKPSRSYSDRFGNV